MDKLIPVVVIKELAEVDTILPALKNNQINCAEITFRTACAAEAIAYACQKYPDILRIGADVNRSADFILKILRPALHFPRMPLFTW